MNTLRSFAVLSGVSFAMGFLDHSMHGVAARRTVSNAPAHKVARSCVAEGPLPALGRAYSVAGAATVVSWSACAVVGLSTHPTLVLPVRHNVLTIAQALAPLPLGAAVFGALAAASKAGWKRLHSVTYRRLNLGMAASSAWLAAAAWWAPAFAAGYRMYSLPFRLLVAATHLAVAALCCRVWATAVDAGGDVDDGSGRPKQAAWRRSAPRVARGFVGSVWSLPPKDAATAEDGRNEYAMASALFFCFAMMPLMVGFPLATVPTILGKRLSRAAGAWTFLAAVVAYVLKDAAERGRLHASTFRTLRRGLAAASGAHLLLVALKLAGIDGGRAGLLSLYPGALSVPGASLASLVMYCLSLFAALTPPRKE